MGRKTIYVRDEDEALWEHAKQVAGESVSALIVEGLRAVIARRERESHMEHLVAQYWLNDRCISKAFRGIRLHGQPNSQGTFDADSWQVVLTPRGQYVIWHTGSDQVVSQTGLPVYINPGFWGIFQHLEEIPENVPKDVFTAVANVLDAHPEWIPELDL